jgi:hypothetical protein
MKRLRFEREFFRLAAVMWSAQLEVTEGQHGLEAFRFHLLGVADYGHEMKLLCKEVLG